MIKKALYRNRQKSPELNSANTGNANRSIFLLLLALALTGLLISEELNQSLFLALNTLLSQLPGTLWINITNLGSTLAGAALVCLLLPRRPYLVLHIVISGLLCTLVIYGFKHSLDVIRPHLVLDRTLFHFIETNITSPARPSGHTATGFFIAGSAWGFLNSAIARISILLLALLIGLSRVAIGVHWPLDLIWGAFIGLAMGYGGAMAIYFLSGKGKVVTGKDTLGMKAYINLSLGVICFIAAYFIFKPLPYDGENIPSYLTIYAALGISVLGCLKALRG